MWNPYEKRNVKNRLYVYYSVGIFCLAGLTPSFGEIIHAWKNRKNISMFTQHFTLVTAMTSTVGKIVNLWYRRADLEVTTDLLNWERQQPCNREFAICRDEILISTIRACKLFSWIFIIMVFWYCLFSAGKDLVYSKGDMDKLSTSPVWLYLFNETSSYWLMFIIDKTTISYLAGCTACHDIFFMVFLLHVGAQLDLLKRRLESSKKKLYDARKNDLIANDYGMYDLKIECMCRSNLEESSLNPIVELHLCIEHHQVILRYANLVQCIFNNTILLQFFTSLLVITMAGFRICGERKLSNNELIDTVNFLTCALFQLFLYCWFGAEVIWKSETIGLSAYYSKWYDADVRLKKTLSLVLHRGQIPIVFTAGNICELSLQTFMNAFANVIDIIKMIGFRMDAAFIMSFLPTFRKRCSLHPQGLRAPILKFSRFRLSLFIPVVIRSSSALKIISKCYSCMALLKQVNE